MNTKLYTSLQSSKLIHAVLPELESEMWYEIEDGGKYERHGEIKQYVNFYPKLMLHDLLLAIELWGEKMGWKPYTENVYNSDGSVDQSFRTKQEHTQHALLDIWRRTKDLSCKEVDDFISNTFRV